LINSREIGGVLKRQSKTMSDFVSEIILFGKLRLCEKKKKRISGSLDNKLIIYLSG
jgi:hypothetical protein